MSNKNVMFIAKINNNDDWSKKMEKWSLYTIPKIENYCKKHNIDLVILDNDDLNQMKMPAIFQDRYHWHKNTLISIYAIKQFSTDKKYLNYDNMCYMDIDIDIVKDDENLFDYVNENAFYSLIIKNAGLIDRCNKYLKLYFDFEHNDLITHIQSGVFCMKKEIAHNLSKYLPAEDEWISFLSRNKDYNAVIMDQEIFPYALHISNTKVTELNKKWNCFYKGKTENDAFIHYMGGEGKKYLLKLSNNEKIPEWKWSNDEKKWIEK